MTNKNYYAIIMAGGVGSRFWPLSKASYPKQFHDILGAGETLIQRTFGRLSQTVPSDNVLVLTNENYKGLVNEQLPKVKDENIVLEPAMRNTAPCILLAALKIYKANPDGVMIVAPSDHWIEDEDAFLEDVQICFDACQREDYLMTLGIKPTFPNTGYGYIEAEKKENSVIKKVKQFREKPDYETAKQFLAEGNFMWNAGIFLWSVASISEAFEENNLVMHALFSEGIPAYNTSEEKEFIAKNYEKAENISIDYAIMEKADNVYVKKASFDWNDLGTWGALHEKMEKDFQENAVVRAIPYMKDSHGNMVYSASKKLVVVDGIDDYIIVDRDDVLLIYPKKKEQDIKTLLAEVKENFGKKYT